MLEVVFSDSVKGAMRMAKSYNQQLSDIGAYPDEKPAKTERESQFPEKALTGSPAEVVCIGFLLDIGDIAGEFDGEMRRREFHRIFGSVSFSDQETAQFFGSLRKDFDKMLAAAKDSEPIRIWKSNAPFSACAFAFLCDSLRDIDCQISVISLPEYWEAAKNTLKSCTDWGEIPPGQFYRFLPRERQISPVEKRLQSDRWRELKAENAPLRALVNGRLISVPENFYDHIIARYIPDGEFMMAWLIGTVLRKCPFGIGDGWYALRIRQMIANHKLEIVGGNTTANPYGEILRKVPSSPNPQFTGPFLSCYNSNG